MGIYYQTLVDESLEVARTIFGSQAEAYHASQAGLIQQRQLIKIRMTMPDGKVSVIETTVGRLQFNDLLPESLRFVNEAVTAKRIKDLVTIAIHTESAPRVSELIDDIKQSGFYMATHSGLSVAVTDCRIVPEKDAMIETANKQVEEIQQSYLAGLLTLDEKRRLTFDTWIQTTDSVAEKTWDSYAETNAVKVMINSGGTRASKDQVKQLAAMRGLVVDPLGKIVEMPTKSNFRQGLTIFEYVTSARGSRKGLTDSALKTADAGYLTRRLCDVAHNVIIRMEDCGTDQGIVIHRQPRKAVFGQRLTGRVTNQDIVIGKKTLVAKGELITDVTARDIEASNLETVEIRSPLTCEAPKGLCVKCYGWDFSTRDMVQLGVPVGVIAAQSIGEPGTQLTMRVKHSGGIVGLDVTQGLPRVEELFEARIPKNQAVMSEVAGQVSLETSDGGDHVITITNPGHPSDTITYTVPAAARLLVKDDELISVGQSLIEGSIDVKQLLQLAGMLTTQEYLISSIQGVYESQGISIHDKHFEVIVRKMSDKVQIELAGDTQFLTGEIIERSAFVESNDATMAAGGQPATAKVILLGITRASLFTQSWLSAASFQHTKHVLTDAATVGAIDYLEGLKENVIIGRLIPTSRERAEIKVA
jgi:DNA-directed RNA polymerase subunit beta'